MTQQHTLGRIGTGDAACGVDRLARTRRGRLRYVVPVLVVLVSARSVCRAQDPTGFRFRPDGNGVLLISEAGCQRPSNRTARQVWIRAGYMRNSTRYPNRATGRQESGNYCAYVLMDYQLRMPDPASPARGLFLGGTAMTVPSRFTPYDRYYEARLYQRGTFPSRPTDVLTFIASYRGHSRYFTDSLVAQGKSVWRNSPSLTGTYTVHAARGNYLSLSLGYVRGPAMSPCVNDALTFTANWSLYL